MNYLWAFMILTGIIYGAFHGTLPQITTAALDSAKEAVTLCITMMGVMSFWVGLMRIAEKAGIIEGLSRKMRPVLHFLFPDLPQEHPANEYIATNMIANIFGLGWAATPAGLKAMQQLQELHIARLKAAGKNIQKYSGNATKEMSTFLIINISSLQLIPMNIVAYRSQYGSVHPAAVVGPGLAATIISTATAVIFCRIVSRRRTD